VSAPVDAPGAVRRGEALDADRLAACLAGALPEAADLAAGELTIEQFPGGHSNLTYRIAFRGRELVLRRPPFGTTVATAHDMAREHRVLAAIADRFPLAPRPRLLVEDPDVLGAPFFLMDRIPGVILRRDPPPGFDLAPATAAALGDALIDTMLALHAAPPPDGLGHPEGYVERQVSGWTGRYAKAQTDAIPAMDEVAAWLATHRPASPAATLIHNDLKFDNLVLDPTDPTRVVGVLDWEMATVGDPLMDLGTALSYWVEPGDPPALAALRFGPTDRPGMPTRRALAARYAARGGRSIDAIVFYYAFGLWKTAVVVQQIYARWKRGATQDPRFAGFIYGVRALGERAAAAIAAGAI
jgi:aminoglycoside phosphotransferase (APT) family kinase protein